jgi:hypothetical protein
LSWPGIEELYSGVAISRPSCRRDLLAQCGDRRDPQGLLVVLVERRHRLQAVEADVLDVRRQQREAAASRRELCEPLRRLPEMPRMRIARYACRLDELELGVSVTSFATAAGRLAAWP